MRFVGIPVRYAKGVDGLGTLQAGQELGGYVLLRPLGRGGSAVVWEVRDGNGDRFALKILHPIYADDEAMRVRLLREARTVNLIRDPGVARVVDLETEGSMAFVVTELIDGVSLREDLDQHGPMTFADARAVAMSLAQTLDAVHATGVVHRDLKPSNIVLGPQRPVLIDFGIASAEGDERLTGTGLVSGTLGWVCPEVLSGAEPDAASDWWAWAALFVNMVTARAPFGTGNLSAVLSRVHLNQVDLQGIHPQLAKILRAALSPASQRPNISTIRRQLAELDAQQIDSWNEEATTALNTSALDCPVTPATATLSPQTAVLGFDSEDVPAIAEATALYPLTPVDLVREEPEGSGTSLLPVSTAGLNPASPVDYETSRTVSCEIAGRLDQDRSVTPGGYPVAAPLAAELIGYQYHRAKRARVLVWPVGLLLTVLPTYFGWLGFMVMVVTAICMAAIGYAHRWRERRRCTAGGARGDDTVKAVGVGVLAIPKAMLAVAVSAGAASAIAVLAGALWSLSVVGQISPNPVLELLSAEFLPSRPATAVVGEIFNGKGLRFPYLNLALWGVMVFVLAATRIGPGGWQMSEGSHALVSWLVPNSTLRWILAGLVLTAAAAAFVLGI